MALGSGTFAYFVSGHLPKLKMTIVVLDAAGLGLFAESGTEVALSFHLNPLASKLLGVLTGASGGIIRDVLVAKIPRVLQVEIYASAALVGAAVAVLGYVLGVTATISSVAGVHVCFVIRVVNVSRVGPCQLGGQVRASRSYCYYSTCCVDDKVPITAGIPGSIHHVVS